MKIPLIIFFICLISTSSYGQQTFELREARVRITIPDKWTYGGNENVDSVVTHYFDRDPLLYKYWNGKDSISAVVSVSTETINELDAVTFSAKQRMLNPFEVLEVFIPKDIDMQHKNGICYKGSYANKMGMHNFYIIYLKNRELGITVMCDISDDLFEFVKPDFISIIKSIITIE